MRLSKRTSWILITTAVVVYLCFSLVYLDLPGLECDENIFVNAALGNLDGTYVEWHSHLGRFDIPVMIMRYIGAVKSYLYAPIFALFGTGVDAVRLPVVMFGLCTLYLTYATVRAMIGRETAVLSLVILAADPSFIFANRLDWGPVSLMMVLKTAALYLIWRWLEHGRLSCLVLAAFLMGVGLFDKVVFAWFIAAVAAALPFCFWSRLKSRLTGRAAALALLAFFAGCLPLIAYNVRFPLITFKGQQIVTTSWPDALAYRYRVFRNTLSGSEILFMINEQAPAQLAETYRQPATSTLDTFFTGVLRILPLHRSPTALASALALAFIVWQGMTSRLRAPERVWFLVLLFLFTTVQICLTAQATGPHHVIMAYPFVQILIAWASLEMFRLAGSARSQFLNKAAQAVVAGGIGLVLLAPIVVDMGYLKAFKVRGGSGRWSDAIYRLDDYVKKNPDKQFLLMDWGFGPQLLALKSGKIHWEEAFVPTLECRTESEKIESLYPYLFDPDDLFVFHPPHFATYPILDTFQKALARYGLEAQIVAPFFQRDGSLIYVVCKTSSADLASYRERGNYFYFREGEDYDSCSRDGVDFKPTASMKRALGNYWGTDAADFATYRWSTTREIDDLTMSCRYSSEASGNMPIDVFVDGRRAGTLELEPTGGFGSKPVDWRMARIELGNVSPGKHELRFQALAAHHPVNLDYFYLAEGEFALSPPTIHSAADLSQAMLNLEVLGYGDRPDVRIEVGNPVLLAGESTLTLRVVNLDAPAIDVSYTFDGKPMPILRGWHLNSDHSLSVFLDENTPKGRYVYKAIRDSRDPSPTAWISVNVPMVVK